MGSYRPSRERLHVVEPGVDVAGLRHVVVAVEFHQPGVDDDGGDLPGPLDRHRRVATAVEDEDGRSDGAQQGPNIDDLHHLEQFTHRGRAGGLPLVPRFPGPVSRVAGQGGCEHVEAHRLLGSPPPGERLVPLPSGGDFLRCLVPMDAGPRADQDHAVHARWVGRGERESDRSALRHAENVRSLDPRAVHDGPDILDRSSIVGMRVVRSDAPVPRLSKWRTLAKDPRRSHILRYSGRSHRPGLAT